MIQNGPMSLLLKSRRTLIRGQLAQAKPVSSLFPLRPSRTTVMSATASLTSKLLTTETARATRTNGTTSLMLTMIPSTPSTTRPLPTPTQSTSLWRHTAITSCPTSARLDTTRRSANMLTLQLSSSRSMMRPCTTWTTSISRLWSRTTVRTTNSKSPSPITGSAHHGRTSPSRCTPRMVTT